MKPYKKLTLKQALIALGNGKEIRTEPRSDGEFSIILVSESEQLSFENIGYMSLLDFADEQWYLEFSDYQELF